MHILLCNIKIRSYDSNSKLWFYLKAWFNFLTSWSHRSNLYPSKSTISYICASDELYFYFLIIVYYSGLKRRVNNKFRKNFSPVLSDPDFQLYGNMNGIIIRGYNQMLWLNRDKAIKLKLFMNISNWKRA